AAPAAERARLVDGENGDEATVAPVRGEEAAVIAAALFDGDLVSAASGSRELDARAVLVRPEVGRLDRAALMQSACEQRRHGDGRPFHGTGPVLDTVRRAVHVVMPRRAVADGHHVGNRRFTAGTTEHTVAEFQAAAPKPFDVG